ncbi:MAG: VWA domain-containing protein [Sandaracinaceae bacterium]
MALALVFLGCDPGGGTRPDGGGGDDTGPVGPTGRDTDGDGILDRWEGADEGVDTDGDGTPDFEDLDSDGDGIPDSVEGRPNPSTGEPADSDGDGVYDFRDDDSDGNGILDMNEPEGDLDGDGIPDFADTDDDGDLISDRDEIGDAAAPTDTDGDGMPDYRDTDSDGDTIGDIHEGTFDTDGDGTLDRHDLDSDDDTWTDAEEAGDADINTPPIDTDGDLVPDFRDADADGDGLSDERERALGTSPTNPDTDGDGVSDLVEVSACPEGDASCAMDATDPTSSPRARGDFVFAEPYMMPPMPMRDTLDFATDIRVADVYFLIDTTGSMGGAITNVRSSLSTPGTGIIDQVRGSIPDAWFGVGDFKDYNACSYGSGTDYAYRHAQDMSMDAMASQTAVNGLSASGGFDGPESHVPALWATATGMGLAGRATSAGPIPARSGCPAGTFGYPCFRSGAVPIVVMITDVDMHNDPMGNDAYESSSCTGGFGGGSPIGATPPTFAEAVTAATMNRVRVIGVAVNGGGMGDLQTLATMTGAVDGTGSPLVSSAPSGSVSSSVVNAIQTLAMSTRFDISVNFEDDPSDAVETFAAFVDHIEANVAGDASRGCDPRPADDTDGDGFPDTFRSVTAGERVCFDIIVKQNDTVMPTTDPQLFRATLRVLGDGFTELDSRDVFFLVPPEIIIGGPD